MLVSTVRCCSMGTRCRFSFAQIRQHITCRSSVYCISHTKDKLWSYNVTKGIEYSSYGPLAGRIVSVQGFPLRPIQLASNLYSTDGNKQIDPNQEPEKKLTLIQKFKQMYKDYWYVLVPVHLITSLGWFGGFYYLTKSGVDVVALMESLGFSEKLINPLRDSKAGYIALTYALYKIATPVRYTVTLGGTTISIKYLKEWGYIKPMPKQKLQEIYNVKKEHYQGELKLQQEKLKKKRDSVMRSFQDRAGSKSDK